ncbi:MAG: TIGR01777 family oxidoreductase [Bacteroidales bacterium]
MIIALAGYTGFIGSHIKDYFSEEEFILLEREDLAGQTDKLADKIKGADVVINSVGYPVSKRWNRKNRNLMHQSRIDVTQKLVQAINILKNKPDYYVHMSAIGIYAYDKEHSEIVYTYGDDFLAGVVREWEDTVDDLHPITRVIKVRSGMVLGRNGGVFVRLKRIFKLGLGGVIGSGKQVYSFIHMEDLLAALKFLMDKNEEGVFNFTAPNPVTNKQFTKALAASLNRPAIFRVPAILLRLWMGKGAVIATRGQTVYPKKLLDAGYKFTFATIDKALVNLVNRS